MSPQKFRLIHFFLQHPVAANLLMLSMLLGGIWGFKQVNTQLNPTRHYTRVIIDVSWPGSSAVDVAALVSSPVELKLRNLIGLEQVTSKTSYGVAAITLDFKVGTDMALALEEVRQIVDLMKSLPQGIEKPLVYRYQRKELVAAIVVSTVGDWKDLVPIVREYEHQLLDRGIEEIQFNGLPQQELAVQLSVKQIQDIGLSLPELADQINFQSQDYPAGIIGYGSNARQLRSLEQARNSRHFKNIVINSGEHGPPLYLGDISKVVQRVTDGQVHLQLDGQSAIEMLLLRTPATDTVDAARILNQWLEEVSLDLPSGLTLSVSKEGWKFLQDTMDLLVTNGVQGFALVLLTLYLFLNSRVATWVALGIPVTLLAALGLFAEIFDGDISMVSLIAFVMALGIIVDDAIVVGEATLSHRTQGYSPEQAAQMGASSMLSPVMASSLTTLAAFIPLLLIPGPFGDTTVVFPQVLLCVIVASLLECFLILPKHLQHGFSSSPITSGGRVYNIKQFFENGLFIIRDEKFVPLLERLIRNRGASILAALFVFVLAIGLMVTQRVGFALGANVDIEFIQAHIQFRSSTSQQQRRDYIAQLRAVLVKLDATLQDPMITQVLSKENYAIFNEEEKRGPLYSSIDVEVVAQELRPIAIDKLARRWREALPKSTMVEDVYIKAFDANRYKGAFSILLKSDDAGRLKAAAVNLKTHIKDMPGVIDVFDDLPNGSEQWVYQLTETAKQLGLSTTSLGQQIRAAYQGQRFQIYNDGKEEIDVKVMLIDEQRKDLESLSQLPIKVPNGKMLPLSTLARIKPQPGLDVVRHHNGQQRIKVQVFVDPDVANSLAMVSKIQSDIMPSIIERYNVRSEIGEHSRRSKEQLDLLSLGGLYALLLIYMVLAWFFASFFWPIVVMAAIPLALTGAIAGHWVMGFEFGSMSFLGCFALIGIIINDSIVLISYYRRHRPKRATKTQIDKAILDAAQSRFRPVSLTSLTTIAGLAPLMLDQSGTSTFFVPLAATICFGLAYGTFLVLIIIPCLISVMEQLADLKQSWFGFRLEGGQGRFS